MSPSDQLRELTAAHRAAAAQREAALLAERDALRAALKALAECHARYRAACGAEVQS